MQLTPAQVKKLSEIIKGAVAVAIQEPRVSYYSKPDLVVLETRYDGTAHDYHVGRDGKIVQQAHRRTS